MQDPTFVKADINANPVWKLAFEISEHINDESPIGWGGYIPIARVIVNNYGLKPKVK